MAPMRIDLSSDVAIVTGGARGNGAAIARGLAAAGARVAIGDVLGDAVDQLAGELRDTGAEAFSAPLDVTDPESCAQFRTAVEAALGPVSILVNNAGIIHRDPFDGPGFIDNWDRIVRVNLDGMRNMMLSCLASLRANRGRVLNMGSILSSRGGHGVTAYAASKGAVAQFTRALAVELAPEGVRVNALAPGVIATPMTEETRADPASIGPFLAHTPMGRVGEPEELVGPALFLVSEMSSYVTGAVLPVDGGYLAL